MNCKYCGTADCARDHSNQTTRQQTLARLELLGQLSSHPQRIWLADCLADALEKYRAAAVEQAGARGLPRPDVAGLVDLLDACRLALTVTAAGQLPAIDPRELYAALGDDDGRAVYVIHRAARPAGQGNPK